MTTNNNVPIPMNKTADQPVAAAVRLADRRHHAVRLCADQPHEVPEEGSVCSGALSSVQQPLDPDDGVRVPAPYNTYV